jgi:4,5-DOPA dioxygenase extradiol
VVQLSINAMKPLDHHVELGAQLAPLRDRGVLVLGSGNVVPALYLAGLAAAAGRPARIMVEGYAYGSLSMTSYTLDAAGPEDVVAGAQDAAPIPDPDLVPPDGTNI